MTNFDSCLPSLAQNTAIQAIHYLFNGDERLIQFLFHHKRTELREPPSVLLEEARGFSHGEILLTRAAIDIWCGQGEARLSELLDILDNDNLFHLLCAMVKVRGLIGLEVALLSCDW